MKKTIILITLISILQLSCDDFENPVDSGNSLPNFGGDLTILSKSEHELKLSWESVSGASEYIIERRSDSENTFYIIGSSEETEYVDYGLDSNQIYWYRVYGKNGDNTTNSLIGSKQPYFPEIINLEAEYSMDEGIIIDWELDNTSEEGLTEDYALSSTPKYEIDFRIGQESDFENLTDSESESNYTYSNIINFTGDSFQYRIKAYTDYNYSNEKVVSWNGLDVFSNIAGTYIEPDDSQSINLDINTQMNNYYVVGYSNDTTIIDATIDQQNLILDSGTTHGAATITLLFYYEDSGNNLNVLDYKELVYSVVPDIFSGLDSFTIQEDSQDETLTITLPDNLSAQAIIVPNINDANVDITYSYSDEEVSINPVKDYNTQDGGNSSATLNVRIYDPSVGYDYDKDIDLIISSVNDAPMIDPISIAIIEDSNTEPIDLEEYFSTYQDSYFDNNLANQDFEGDELSYTFVDNTGEIITIPVMGASSGYIMNEGELFLNSQGTYLFYTPFPNRHGVDIISFQVSDGLESSTQEYITITVSPVADNPTVSENIPTLYEVVEDSENNLILIQGEDVDCDYVTDDTQAQCDFSYSIEDSTSHGELDLSSLLSDNFINYIPSEDFSENSQEATGIYICSEDIYSDIYNDLTDCEENCTDSEGVDAACIIGNDSFRFKICNTQSYDSDCSNVATIIFNVSNTI